MSVFCSKVVFSGLPTQHYEAIRTLQQGQPHTYYFIINKKYLGFKFLILCFLQSFERNVFIMLGGTNVSISNNLLSPENFSFKIRRKKKTQHDEKQSIKNHVNLKSVRFLKHFISQVLLLTNTCHQTQDVEEIYISTGLLLEKQLKVQISIRVTLLSRDGPGVMCLINLSLLNNSWLNRYAFVACCSVLVN